LSVVLT